MNSSVQSAAITQKKLVDATAKLMVLGLELFPVQVIKGVLAVFVFPPYLHVEPITPAPQIKLVYLAVASIYLPKVQAPPPTNQQTQFNIPPQQEPLLYPAVIHQTKRVLIFIQN